MRITTDLHGNLQGSVCRDLWGSSGICLWGYLDIPRDLRICLWDLQGSHSPRIFRDLSPGIFRDLRTCFLYLMLILNHLFYRLRSRSCVSCVHAPHTYICWQRHGSIPENPFPRLGENVPACDKAVNQHCSLHKNCSSSS